jgi:transcriptional antiterminator
MFKSFKNNEDCKDVDPYKTENIRKEVILMDINTKNQTTYESIGSLAKEFGVEISTIINYIKGNVIFRKKYRIFPKGDPVPNIEPKRRKEVVLMDINTKNQTTYKSIRSLAKEFGVSHTRISDYIKRKTLFKEKYRIFLKKDISNDNV